MLHRFLKWFLYGFFRTLCRWISILYFRCRWLDRDNVPSSGALLVVANHQSNLDPILIGTGSRRRLSFLAKKTLFVGPFGWFIGMLDAVPVDQEGSSISGMKETLRRLKRDEGVVVFPEGSRSEDGQIAALQSGIGVLARRGKAAILPVGIAGAYDAWPRTARFPRPKRVVVQFGSVIDADAVAALGEAELIATIEHAIRECFERAEARRS